MGGMVGESLNAEFVLNCAAVLFPVTAHFEKKNAVLAQIFFLEARSESWK